MRKIVRQKTISETIREMRIGETLQFSIVDFPEMGLRSAISRARKSMGYDYTISRKSGESFTEVTRIK